MKKEWRKIDFYAKKLKAIDLLGGNCEKCKETDFYKLCFHHENKEDKENNISALSGRRWSVIEKEVKKCTLLCQNCHHEEHFKNGVSDVRRRNMKKLYLEYKNMEEYLLTYTT